MNPDSAPLSPEHDPELRDLILAPPLATASLPSIGGTLRARAEDFVVDEIPAYPPDGREERHLFVRFEKREVETEEAVRRLVRACGVDRREVGVAGRKDRLAVTRQWISLPWAARGALDGFDDPQVRVLEAHPHGQKLRTGHLRGNRFALVVRDLESSVEEALERAAAKVDRLRALGGLENLYGPQRFGWEGRNLDRGLALLRSGRMRRGDNFLASAGQSAAFNLYVVQRREAGLLRRVLRGDVLQKVETGGMFHAEDAATEQARLDAGELVGTGPMPGAKMREPIDGTDSAHFEHEVLRTLDLDPGTLRRFGKRLPGTRRAAQIPLGTVDVVAEPAHELLSAGLRFEFELPSGSFATQLMREIQGDRPEPPRETA